MPAGVVEQHLASDAVVLDVTAGADQDRCAEGCVRRSPDRFFLRTFGTERVVVRHHRAGAQSAREVGNHHAAHAVAQRRVDLLIAGDPARALGQQGARTLRCSTLPNRSASLVAVGHAPGALVCSPTRALSPSSTWKTSESTCPGRATLLARNQRWFPGLLRDRPCRLRPNHQRSECHQEGRRRRIVCPHRLGAGRSRWIRGPLRVRRHHRRSNHPQRGCPRSPNW
jgi:hypothetical protein